MCRVTRGRALPGPLKKGGGRAGRWRSGAARHSSPIPLVLLWNRLEGWGEPLLGGGRESVSAQARSRKAVPLPQETGLPQNTGAGVADLVCLSSGTVRSKMLDVKTTPSVRFCPGAQATKVPTKPGRLGQEELCPHGQGARVPGPLPLPGIQGCAQGAGGGRGRHEASPSAAHPLPQGSLGVGRGGGRVLGLGGEPSAGSC